MNFYLAECVPEIRRLLNDTDSTAYRYTVVQVEDYARDTVNDILRLRPDSALDSGGNIRSLDDVYEYTESAYASVLDEYYRITGWDKEIYPILYLASTASVITVYGSSADRTVATGELATVSAADSTGIRKVVQGSSSGFGGMVLVTAATTNTATWDITATEAPLFDRIFKNAFIYGIIHRCFLADSEDTGDTSRAVQYAQLFAQHIGV